MLIIPKERERGRETAFACLLGDITKLRCVDALKKKKPRKKLDKIKSKLGVVCLAASLCA